MVGQAISTRGLPAKNRDFHVVVVPSAVSRLYFDSTLGCSSLALRSLKRTAEVYLKFHPSALCGIDMVFSDTKRLIASDNCFDAQCTHSTCKSHCGTCSRCSNATAIRFLFDAECYLIDISVDMKCFHSDCPSEDHRGSQQVINCARRCDLTSFVGVMLKHSVRQSILR